MCKEISRINRKSILIAMTLGDGYLRVEKKAGISITHGEKQLDYLLYKKELLESILNCKPITVQKVKPNKYNTVCYRIDKGHKYFRILRKWIYLNGKKTFTRKILNYLTPLGIAIWYMDDGGLSAKKRNGKIHAYELFLNTHLTKFENQVIINYFKERWNINFQQVKNKGSYRLRMSTKEIRNFMTLIKEYIHPSMVYKILV
jgi:hypothetical protein